MTNEPTWRCTLIVLDKPVILFKERPGVISKDSCYVAMCTGYLYTADTLEELLTRLETEWEQDQHLVG